MGAFSERSLEPPPQGEVLSEAKRACEEKYLMDTEQDDDAVK